MNRIFLIAIIFGWVFLGCTETDKDIIRKTVSKLNSIDKVEFLNVTHYYQTEMGLDRIDTAFCFLDFTSNDTLLGAKYQFVHKLGEQVYNGNMAFSLDKSEERIIYSNVPNSYDVGSSIFMMNSILTLKKLLPEFLKDSTVSIYQEQDSIIDGENNYKFNISIHNKYINIGAILSDSKNGSNYSLFISKKTFLPTQFKTNFPDNKGFWSSSFSEYKFNSTRPDSIWNINTLPQEYLRIEKQEFTESLRKKAAIQFGQKAPDWILPLLDSNDSIQLSKQNGKLVLLEFWFPYCSGCVKAIPSINEIKETYSYKGLEVYGIEFTKSNDKGLNEYIQKQKILYPTLHTGKDVAQNYRINAAPTFYLIDKNGIIKYSSVGLNRDELIKSIEDNI